MPVSPADFALWARATGNKYPETAEEKIAAAPYAYEYARNLGRTGQDAPSGRVGGRILYNNPESVQNPSPNSLFDAPVTPDNDARKVAGTLDKTLTSEHFVNQEQNEVENQSRARQVIDAVGKTALAAGALAAGVALARNPGVQQAVRSAGTSIKENAQDIGSRVSNFLGGFGGGQTSDPSVVRNSGDITPPTTGQRYQQEHIPTATQEIQVAKGASVGAPEKALLETKPVTESEVISTSQTFGPKDYTGSSYMLDEYERAHPPSQDIIAARRKAATEDLLAASKARANAPTAVQPSIPGINPTLYALRDQGNVDLSTGELLDATARGWQKTPSYEGTQLDIPFGATTQPTSSDVGRRLASVGVAMSGAPENLGGSGVSLYHEAHGRDINLTDPASQIALAKAGVSTEEVLGYWNRKLNESLQNTGTQQIESQPSVSSKVGNFLTVLDLKNKQAIQIPGSQLGVGVAPATRLTGSLVGDIIQPTSVIAPSVESTIEATPYKEQLRQQLSSGQSLASSPESEAHTKAFNLIAAGAERGHKIPFERALQIVTNTDPGMELSHGEQQAYQFGMPVTVGRHQSFDPEGYQATGQTRTLRTGENPNQKALSLLDRYAAENVSGLTKQGRQGAGRETLRPDYIHGETAEVAQPSLVIPTAGGRTMRSMGALDPEALSEGREEYAPHTFQTAGTTDPAQLAKTRERVESSYMVKKLNNLFGPETSSGMLHLKTDQGVKPIGTRTFQKTVGPIADDVFARAASHYAAKQGIDLPVTQDPNTGLQKVEYDNLDTANAVLYGNSNVSKQAVQQMGNAFKQSLSARMNLNLGAQEPDSMHTLMGVARNTATGNLALENFGKLAGRARSQGRIRTTTSMVPTGIPKGATSSGMTPEDVSRTIQNIYATQHPDAHQRVQEFVASLQPRQ